MKICLMLAFCFFLIGASHVSAQRPPDYKTVYDANPNRPFEPMPSAPIHYTLTIPSNGSAELKLPNAAEIKGVSPVQAGEYFTALAAKKNTPDSTWFKDVVTVMPDGLVKLESIAAYVHAIRNAYTSKIRVEADKGVFALVPKKLAPGNSAKPNPLTLLVTVKADGKIDLNREPQGTVSDTSTLTDFLRKIFKEREANGVYRVGSNLIESTVFLKMPLSLTWGEASKVIKAMHDGGADPIGLQLDDLK
jgi:biopolymer transport protein ExbD